jgi:hypothetical protein
MRRDGAINMQVYFDIVHRDDRWSPYGSTWIVPALYYSSIPTVGPVLLSHDCGSFSEMECVINGMIYDLDALRRKAKKHFETLIKQSMYADHLKRKSR